ncbi:hypothetical protein J6590_042082 [Homalodisca vitripennis]|nr:hypothetical protein J6590_042082 [Homalodisca vitripennis]
MVTGIIIAVGVMTWPAEKDVEWRGPHRPIRLLILALAMHFILHAPLDLPAMLRLNNRHIGQRSGTVAHSVSFAFNGVLQGLQLSPYRLSRSVCRNPVDVLQ